MIRKMLAVSAFAFASVGATAGNAANYDLAFIMDASGSINNTEFTSAMSSLATALATSIPVGGTDTYTIGVVTFAQSATATVNKVTVTSAADLTAITTAITNENRSGIGSVTNYKAAFDAVHAMFGSTLGSSSIINMMTDGQPNDPGSTANAKAVASASAAVLRADGWDSLSFESVGGQADNGYLSGLGWDTGGVGGLPIFTSANQITDPLNSAFVLDVSDFGPAYSSAIATKVQKIVIPGVPVPAALPMFAAALGLFGFLGRRRRGRAA